MSWFIQTCHLDCYRSNLSIFLSSFFIQMHVEFDNLFETSKFYPAEERGQNSFHPPPQLRPVESVNSIQFVLAPSAFFSTEPGYMSSTALRTDWTHGN